MTKTMAFVKREGSRPFPPRVSSFTEPFWTALSAGRLVTTACRACGRISFPPKPVCRSCWSKDVEWRELSPRGTLYSFTVNHVAPRTFRHEAPYSVALVDLEDGIRLMCGVAGFPTVADIGRPVEMVVLSYEDGSLFAARIAERAR